MPAVADRRRMQNKLDTWVYYELHPDRIMKVRGVELVSNMHNPDAGERVPILEEAPPTFTIPPESYRISDNGSQEVIRYIFGCKTIIKEEQEKYKFNPTRNDQANLTLIRGVLGFDAAKDKARFDYLESSHYLHGDMDGNPPVIVRIEPDQKQRESLTFDYLYGEALVKIKNMSEDDAYDLLLAKGFIRDDGINEGGMKVLLIQHAKKDPQYILNGIDDELKRRVVIARKAIDKGYITLSSPNTANWIKGGLPDTVIVKLGDLGGEDGKFDRFVEFLNTDDGRIVRNKLVSLIGDVEVRDLNRGEEPDEEDEEDAALKPKHRGRPKR